jgi:hypothetical protein
MRQDEYYANNITLGTATHNNQNGLIAKLYLGEAPFASNQQPISFYVAQTNRHLHVSFQQIFQT